MDSYLEKNSRRPIILLSLFIIAILAGCGGGGGGNDSANIDGDTTVQLSEVADIWRAVFYQADDGADMQAYLYFNLGDEALYCVSEYQGAAVSNPVTVQDSDLSFLYQADQRDWELEATLTNEVLTGTWRDPDTGQTGTWSAEKGLSIDTLVPLMDVSEDVVLELVQEDDTQIVTIYGTPPADNDPPVIDRYAIDTEAGLWDLVLNENEQITSSVLGDIELTLSYHGDGSFDYEIYSEGVLIFSGTDLTLPTTPAAAQAMMPAQSLARHSNTAEDDLKASQFYENVAAMKSIVIVDSLFNLNRKLIEKKLILKSGFEAYATSNEAFLQLVEKQSVLWLLSAYHIQNIKKACAATMAPEKCNNYLEKTKSLWVTQYSVLRAAILDLLIQLHEEFGGELCKDNDGDQFYGQSNCGTKLDCADNNAATHPGAGETCSDGIDNDCNGKTDCDDSACSSDPACTQTGPVFKLVETQVLLNSYESTREETCLGEGRDGEIISLDGNSINGQWYSFSKYCGNHFDINGTITFDTPPETVSPGAQVTLTTSGSLSGYQDCCFLYLWFNYYTDAGTIEVSPAYLQLDLRTLPISQVSYPDDGTTRDGWQGTVTGQATTTFTFPSAATSEFLCRGQGTRGVGYLWRYQLQE